MTERTAHPYMTERMAFSVEEVCDILGVSHVTVYARIKDGTLRSASFGRRRLILRKDVEALARGEKPERPEVPALPPGHVYFISNGSFIKIGWAISPEKRMGELQTASPLKLTLMHSMPGNKKLEAGLHRQFKHLHSHGEWFKGESDLRQYIRELMK